MDDIIKKSTSDKIEQLLQTGDRVEWRKLIPTLANEFVVYAWIRATEQRIEDMAEVAFTEAQRRGS